MSPTISSSTRSTQSEKEKDHADLLGTHSHKRRRDHKGHCSSAKPIRGNGDAQGYVWGQADIGLRIACGLTVIPSLSLCYSPQTVLLNVAELIKQVASRDDCLGHVIVARADTHPARFQPEGRLPAPRVGSFIELEVALEYEDRGRFWS